MCSFFAVFTNISQWQSCIRVEITSLVGLITNGRRQITCWDITANLVPYFCYFLLLLTTNVLTVGTTGPQRIWLIPQLFPYTSRENLFPHSSFSHRGFDRPVRIFQPKEQLGLPRNVCRAELPISRIC